ncbi:adenylosuccinate lyase [Campylobacter sp. US33a]|uniref:Adenylosuccinate lyase n=1 Tax=Campylobacter sp. CCS1377 TaxID=3158229 RepID=A0AAU7E901_9BACT|nr:adenylosuccinate lyase [Campylobacter sp. US33a]MCW1359821.1 adenylosuccinate lyase [Campylobacter jejuni]TEY03085.1 adenylosuccinate lyase [Campylobacter sp. US33a]
MQVIQTLQSIHVNTDDVAIFDYFKALIKKNFSKVIGKKNKIFSFFEESEIPQRRYFLKLLNTQYKKISGEDIENINFAHQKTFRLNFQQENTLKPVIFIKVDFDGGLIFKFDTNERLFVAYIKQYFKNHHCEYDENLKILTIDYKDESTFSLFEIFANESEHLKYCVNFNIDEEKYKNFKKQIHKKEEVKWKFNALAKLFNNYFTTLECTPQNNLDEIRQKYLILVKLYHPDFYHGKSSIEKAYARERFEKIQIAYDNLKALYKNNT